MFEIDENDLPIVRTRQAFLILDLQHDFVSTGSLLSIKEPSNLVEKIVNVASRFRDSGNNVTWIRTIFERSRPVNLSHGDSEKILTDEEVSTFRRGDENEIGKGKPEPSSRLLERHNKILAANGKDGHGTNSVETGEEEVDSINEAYLTVEPGKHPQAAVASLPGANFTTTVGRNIDVQRDLIFQKSHYSAFKDGKLVQILRAQFVTEIYICGALTNISIFATAMDAARHGYTITILEDCLGYRSKARHDEALRRLSEFTGCDIISSFDLIEDLERRAKGKADPRPKRNVQPAQNDSSLDKLMSNLKLKPASSTASRLNLGKSPDDGVVGSPFGSSESQLPNQPSQATDSASKSVEGASKPRERVKTKIRTRRRRPENSSQAPVSPTSATLLKAAQSSEKTTESKAESGPGFSSESMGSDQVSSRKESVEPEDQKQMGQEETIVIMPDESYGESVRKQDEPIPLCEGDTTVIEDILYKDLAEGIFDKMRDEVRWQKMLHQGGDVPRLVAVQGEVAEDGCIPVYRHPADESPPMLPYSPVVTLIQREVEKKLGHPVNHVLIQYYRDGTDYISEHSDKTLDIAPNTYIANVSLGAQRTMVFRTKKDVKLEDTPRGPGGPIQGRKTCRAPLPHNSMCKMGLVTNMRWLHAIRQDKRLPSQKSEAELAYGGGRISLTFRLIGTFLDKDQQKIWGQGATSKTQQSAKAVINGNTPEAQSMIRAFGRENHLSEFDWSALYGAGFDVLHISNTPKLFLSRSNIANTRVKLLLAKYNINWTEGKLSPSFNWKDGSPNTAAPSVPEQLPVKFVDNDSRHSTVTGDLAIMLYLDCRIRSEI